MFWDARGSHFNILIIGQHNSTHNIKKPHFTFRGFFFCFVSFFYICLLMLWNNVSIIFHLGFSHGTVSYLYLWYKKSYFWEDNSLSKESERAHARPNALPEEAVWWQSLAWKGLWIIYLRLGLPMNLVKMFYPPESCAELSFAASTQSILVTDLGLWAAHFLD